ncbi:hypothetical protein VNO77_15102 [Canavalia gladiata]|uniref:Uncharacterized protein n=1 Tax=Canavalia gladiata TaxID=3824 RepID=A0AAN9LZY3_CANGL
MRRSIKSCITEFTSVAKQNCMDTMQGTLKSGTRRHARDQGDWMETPGIMRNQLHQKTLLRETIWVEPRSRRPNTTSGVKSSRTPSKVNPKPLIMHTGREFLDAQAGHRDTHHSMMAVTSTLSCSRTAGVPAFLS